MVEIEYQAKRDFHQSNRIVNYFTKKFWRPESDDKPNMSFEWKNPKKILVGEKFSKRFLLLKFEVPMNHFVQKYSTIKGYKITKK